MKWRFRTLGFFICLSTNFKLELNFHRNNDRCIFKFKIPVNLPRCSLYFFKKKTSLCRLCRDIHNFGLGFFLRQMLTVFKNNAQTWNWSTTEIEKCEKFNISLLPSLFTRRYWRVSKRNSILRIVVKV